MGTVLIINSNLNMLCGNSLLNQLFAIQINNLLFQLLLSAVVVKFCEACLLCPIAKGKQKQCLVLMKKMKYLLLLLDFPGSETTNPKIDLH